MPHSDFGMMVSKLSPEAIKIALKGGTSSALKRKCIRPVIK
jgi:hypothetical protein